MGRSCWVFKEVLRPEIPAERNPLCPVYVAVSVEPRSCGPLCKRLSSENNTQEEPSVDLSHLRRVRRSSIDEESSEVHDQGSSESSGEANGAAKKRKRSQVRLDVLLGAVADLEENLQSDSSSSVIETIKETYGIENVEKLMVGARIPISAEEHAAYDHIWPTLSFPNKYKDQKLCISAEEQNTMTAGLKYAYQDEKAGVPGAIIMHPDTRKVISRSAQERTMQQNTQYPLATSIIYAIQGVSRKERESAINNGMGNTDFQTGQYLCTGLDCFTTLEPTPFEASALVHARIRQVIFKTPRELDGGLSCFYIHDLPGTNHRFRAFQLDASKAER